jgi:ankyrin repeat protein
MHTLQLTILKGRLDYFEQNIDELQSLVNRAIYVGENGEHKKHPLHFVCDCVFTEKISEDLGLGFISSFLEHGAYINGFMEWTEDTPLIAAISLYQENIAHYLIDKGADLNHRGVHGATALHWAAWTGNLSLVNALLEFPIDIDVPDIDFGATPLLYSIHGSFRGGERNQNDQSGCLKALIKAGGNLRHKDKEGNNAWAYIKGRNAKAIKAILGDE